MFPHATVTEDGLKLFRHYHLMRFNEMVIYMQQNQIVADPLHSSPATELRPRSATAKTMLFYYYLVAEVAYVLANIVGS